MAKEKEAQNGQELALTDSVKGELANYFGGAAHQMEEGISFRFAGVKVAHQSGAFEMPDGEMTKQFTGVILHSQNANAFWLTSFDDSGGGSVPDCASKNGIRPSMDSSNIQAETCRACGMNVYGSDGKRGKACKNLRRVYVKLDGYDLPVRITIPPTSLKSMDSYVSLLGYRALRMIMVKTKFTLKPSQNKDGIKFSEFQFTAMEPSAKSKEEADALVKMRNDFLPLMREEDIETDDYVDAEAVSQ